MIQPSETQIRDSCTGKDWAGAMTIAIQTYGHELLGFLNALLRDPTNADDVFAAVCEDLWRGLPGFAWRSSFRTWAYAIARNACLSFQRGAIRARRAVPLTSSSIELVIDRVRTETATFQRTVVRDKLAAVRASLAPDDQTLLILRLDRRLSWREVAAVFEPDHASPGEIERRASALRKRLQRLKTELKDRLSEASR